MLSVFLPISLTTLCWMMIAADDSYQGCDCGFENENGLFTNYWFTDFNTFTGDIHRNTGFYVANYTLEAKTPGSYERSFSSNNVNVSNNALQLAVTVDNGTECSSLGTKR
jgi:hypothetical protein